MSEFTLIFDIDGTICPIRPKDISYDDLVPFPEIVEKMKEYREKGAKIILFSSRNMNSYNGNLGLINKNTLPSIIKWLDKWEIPYDEIYVGKPWPGHHGVYVDDRAVRPDEFLKYSQEQLENICSESRCGQDSND